MQVPPKRLLFALRHATLNQSGRVCGPIMSDAAKSLFDNSADIISAASQSPLGIAALVVIAISAISVIFFWNEHPLYKVLALVFLFVGAAGLIVSANGTARPIEQSEAETLRATHGSEGISLFGITLGASGEKAVTDSLNLGNVRPRVQELSLQAAGIGGRFHAFKKVKTIEDLPGRAWITVYMKDGTAFAVSVLFDSEETGHTRSGEYCDDYHAFFDTWYLSETGKPLEDSGQYKSDPVEVRYKEGNTRGTRYSDYTVSTITESFFGNTYATLRTIVKRTLLETVPMFDWLDDQEVREAADNYGGCQVSFFLALRD